jgi:hypothetical protein
VLVPRVILILCLQVTLHRYLQACQLPWFLLLLLLLLLFGVPLHRFALVWESACLKELGGALVSFLAQQALTQVAQKSLQTFLYTGGCFHIMCSTRETLGVMRCFYVLCKSSKVTRSLCDGWHR